MNWPKKISELNESNTPFALVTIINTGGSTPRKVGTKMVVTIQNAFGTIGGGNLEKLVIEQARRCIKSDLTKTFSFPLGTKVGQCCGGVVEIFIEVMNISPNCYIFGAGHVGQAFAKVLEDTPFQVHLIDERKEWISHPDISKNAITHSNNFNEVIDSINWDEKYSYAVVMTHNHDLDQEIVSKLVKQSCKYIGMIGSRHKWDKFKARFIKMGLSENEISKINCPIGLADTGKAPKEIGISVAAEILSIYYAK